MALTGPKPQPKALVKISAQDIKAPPPGTSLKTLQTKTGIDLLGMRQTLRSAKDHYLVTTENGVLAVSETTQRAVEIPWGSIKAIEYDLKTVLKPVTK